MEKCIPTSLDYLFCCSCKFFHCDDNESGNEWWWIDDIDAVTELFGNLTCSVDNDLSGWTWRENTKHFLTIFECEEMRQMHGMIL